MPAARAASVLAAAAHFVLVFAFFALQPDALAATPWTAQSGWNLPQPLDTGADPAIGDLDGDGLPDVLYGTTAGTLVGFKNTGTASSPAWTQVATNSSWVTLSDNCYGGPITNWGYYAVALADLDGDGKIDMVLGTRNYVCVYQNTGSTASPTWTRNTAWEGPLQGLTTNRQWNPTLADVDGDGHVDLLVNQFQLSSFSLWFRNTGAGTPFTPAWTEMDNWALQPLQGDVAMADLDSPPDGLADMMIADSVGNIFAFRNTGSILAPQWVYAPKWSLLAASTSSSPGLALGDLNGDGKADLLYSYGATANSITFQQNPAGLGDSGLASGTPAYTGITVTDTFDSFNCPGSWVVAKTGATLGLAGTYTNYRRDCGNGWTVYAEDVYTTYLTPYPYMTGPIGDQNVVTLDTVNGPSAAPATALGAALAYTAPDVTQRGALWLLKTFPVQPDTPIQQIQADIRGKYGATGRYGFLVFDGIVTDPSGLTDAFAVPQSQPLLAYQIVDNTCSGATAGWCPWQTVTLGGPGGNLMPTTSYITVALEVWDRSNSEEEFGEIDNLSVTNVVNVAPNALPSGNLAQQWSQDYQAPGTNEGGQSSNAAEAKAIKTDAAGNVYVVGDSYNGSNYDIFTAKYSNTGVEDPAWPSQQGGAHHYATYDGGDSDQVAAVALDGAGNVYVTGRSYNTVNGSDDYVVIKYDTNGFVQWASRYDYDSLQRNDDPVAIAVDGSGDVYVTGSTCAGSSDCKYLTVKFSGASGGLLWRAVYDNLGASPVSRAIGIGVDTSGNVYVSGTSRSGSDDIVTIKYDSSGSQLRLNRYDSGNDDRAVAMASDSGGDVYITGTTFVGGKPSILTLEYAGLASSGGAPQWVKPYSYGNEAIPSAITIDAVGNVYVTGMAGDPGNLDWITVKYLNNGDVAWGQTFGNANLDDRALGVAVDVLGNVYVAGSLTSSAGNTNIVMVRYDSSGVALNEDVHDGYGQGDVPVGITLGLDDQGATVPIVVGTSTDETTLDHLVTLGYTNVQPDLTMTEMVAPSLAPIGGNISVANTVLNVSDALHHIYEDSGPFTISYYLAPAANQADRSILLGVRTLTNLTPGETSSDDTVLTIPTDTAPGSYVIVAVADSGGTVSEADEGNNSLASNTFNVGTPDFQVNSVSPDSLSMTRGNSYSVTTSVQNISSYDSPAGTSFRVGVYLSSDNTITTDDILIGTRTITSLAASAIDTAATTVTIPSSITTGSYYVGAIVDDQDSVIETDESNNTGIYLQPGNVVKLDTDTDFTPGLSDPGTTQVVVNGTGTAAQVWLDKDTHGVAWLKSGISTNWLRAAGLVTPLYADFDGDGVLDLITGTTGANVNAFKNTGTNASPTWSTAVAAWGITSACDSTASGGTLISLVDLNGDSLPDLVVARNTSAGSFMCIYENAGTTAAPVWLRADGTGDGTTATGHTAPGDDWEVGLPSTTANNHYAVTAGDLDGDGLKDIMLGRYDSTTKNGQVFGYQNTGTATVPAWAANSAWDSPITGNSSTKSTNWFPVPVLNDVNGNGTLDLMVGGANTTSPYNCGCIMAFQNTGTTSSPTWTRNTLWDVPGLYAIDASYPGIQDLDGDGRPDTVVGNLFTKYAFENVPPYFDSGTYYSAVQDAGDHGGFTTLSFTQTTPANTTLSVDVGAGNSSTPDGTWTWLTGISNGGDISALGTNRYVQFRMNLGADTATTKGFSSPDLDYIQAYTNPATGPTQAIAITVGGSSAGGGGALLGTDLLVLLLFWYQRGRRAAATVPR